MSDNTKCVVLVPIGFALEPETEAALTALAARGYEVRTLRGSSQIDLARSTMATQALRDGFAETLWVDADISFCPDDVDHLRSLDLPFSAGLYPCKGPKRFAGKLSPAAGQVRFGEGGGLAEVEYVGMGFTHIRRPVYEALAQGLPECGGGYGGQTVTPYFLPMLAAEPERPCYLSEDFSFCLRARAVGYPPVVDTRVRVGHIGRKTYTWDDLVPDRVLASLDVEMQPNGEITVCEATDALSQTGDALRQLLAVLKRVETGEYAPGRLHVDLEHFTVAIDPLEPQAAA